MQAVAIHCHYDASYADSSHREKLLGQWEGQKLSRSSPAGREVELPLVSDGGAELALNGSPGNPFSGEP